MELHVVRRAETNQDRSGTTASLVLSAIGESQVTAIAERFRVDRLSAVVSSELPRAIVTAQRLSDLLEVPMTQQSGLHERDFGDWNSWEWSNIAAKLDPLSIEERYEFVPPNGESWQQMERRLNDAIDAIRTMPYESVAIVTHWGPIRALIPMLSGQDKESTLQLTVDNGQSFVLSAG